MRVFAAVTLRATSLALAVAAAAGCSGGRVEQAGPATTAAQQPTTSSGGGNIQTAPLNPNAARVLTTQSAVDMAQLKPKTPPRLQAQFAAIDLWAHSFNLQPQLLVAIAMEESTGGSDENAYANGGGMFQFTDLGTWKAYGTANPNDRADDALSVKAAAFYLATLLNDNGGSLADALRSYNGPVSQGGNPSYIAQIYAKMAGDF